MNKNTYRNAVDHLQFSEELPEALTTRKKHDHRARRFLSVAVLAAVMVCMVFTTAFAVSEEFRNWTISFLNLGADEQDMADAQVMTFRHDTHNDGVSVHYLELDQTNYTFAHGMIYDNASKYLRITADYQLEELEMIPFSAVLEKNDRQYTSVFDCYLETQDHIITMQKNPMKKNSNGEVFMVLTDGASNQWPAYVDPGTGTVRDALPDWSDADFQGRITYAYELWDGILVSTLVQEGNASRNMLYWIGDQAEEAIVIDFPEKEYGWYCENDELYCKNIQGHLFRLNKDFVFELLYPYETGDDLSNGLYTVATENNELAIVDVYTGDTYVISGYEVDPGKASGYREGEGGNIDETTGINAIRYSATGTIALVEKEIDWNPGRVALKKLGVLDTATGEMKYLEVRNDYHGYNLAWLDDHRLAVIYDGKYLCIYEFDSEKSSA